jgi:hypothetical protein
MLSVYNDPAIVVSLCNHAVKGPKPPPHPQIRPWTSMVLLHLLFTRYFYLCL